MAYLLILRRDQDRALGQPPEQMLERFVGWTRILQESGALGAVERLKPSSEAVTLSRRNQDLEVGGRYRDSEDVIGYYLLDVDSIQTARQLASDCPILEVGGSVEIRETEAFHSE